MVTHADNKIPKGLISALEEDNVPYQKYFKFNNSSVFPEDPEEAST